MTNPELDAFLGATPHHRGRHWISVGVLALAVVAAFVLFVRFWSGSDSPYYTAPVERGDLVPVFSARATLHGQDESLLRATQDGVIAAVPAPHEGPIAAQQNLASLDTAPILAALATDRTALAAAQADGDKARVSVDETRTRLDRYENVWRRSAGRVPSLNEMEGARADLARAALSAKTLQAQLDTARLQLRADQARLDGAMIRAPFAGYVVARHVLPGQPVQAGDPLFTLASRVDPLLVNVPLAPAEALRVSAGARARVLLDAMPDRVREATLLRMEPAPDGPGQLAVFALDRTDGTTSAPPGSALRPGMAATVEIPLPPRQAVLLVPNAALAFTPQGAPARIHASLYVLGDDEQPRQVPVSVGASDGQRTEVLAPGLEPGTQVITGWRHSPDTHFAGATQSRKP